MAKELPDHLDDDELIEDHPFIDTTDTVRLHVDDQPCIGDPTCPCRTGLQPIED